MLVGSRRTRKTRHSKRACHRTRHSRGTWKRTETFTYHGKRWSKPYIPIQHRSINRANTDKREISIGFCRFYFPGGKPLPLSQVEATIARITAAFQALPGHRASRAQFHTITKVHTNDIFHSKIIWSWPFGYSLTLGTRTLSRGKLATLTFHWWDNRIIYKGYDLSCRHATCRSIGKCRFSSRLAEIRPATLRWTRSLIFGRKSKQRTSSLLYSPHDSFDSTRE